MKKIKFYSLIQAGAVDVIDVIVESDATILDVLAKLGITDPEATVYFGQLAYNMAVPTRDLDTVVPERHTMYWKAGNPPEAGPDEDYWRQVLDDWHYWDEYPEF